VVGGELVQARAEGQHWPGTHACPAWQVVTMDGARLMPGARITLLNTTSTMVAARRRARARGPTPGARIGMASWRVPAGTSD
jgi:hypothetical protein